ncbi:hypothetical protein FACS1894164_12580 [Spirochaetia bacterium]|nr:hypothetical protein FACS1894164_12580 [Spirochaetia bacterium]
MKRFLFFVFCFCSSLLIAQQTQNPYWFSLEQGKRAFRDGEYGSALLAFEQARHNRRTMYEQMERSLIDVLSIGEVRRMNDDLSRVEQYISDHYHVNAALALSELYYRIPKESLEGSALKALEALGKQKDYPEAEFWIGETYRAEGELSIALSQYQKAYQQRSLLENPGFDIEILYNIVDVLRLQRNYTAMEDQANEILKRDTLWSGDGGEQTRATMSGILENNGIDRFLTIYRYNNFSVERAHRLLGSYYYAYGRYPNAAQHFMFSFLIQNTLIAEAIRQRRYDYRFTTLDALITEAEQIPVIRTYMENVEYYRTLYYCAAAWSANSKSATAREVWTLLTNRPLAGEWASRARRQLRGSFIEPVEREL